MRSQEACVSDACTPNTSACASDRPTVDIREEEDAMVLIVDLPGVIGLITTALGNHGISISHANATLSGEEKKGKGNVTILTHHCSGQALQRAVEEIARLPILRKKPVVVRILEESRS